MKQSTQIWSRNNTICIEGTEAKHPRKETSSTERWKTKSADFQTCMLKAYSIGFKISFNFVFDLYTWSLILETDLYTWSLILVTDLYTRSLILVNDLYTWSLILVTDLYTWSLILVTDLYTWSLILVTDLYTWSLILVTDLYTWV